MSRVWLRHNGSPDWVEVVTDSAEDVRFNFVLDNLENPTNYVSESSYSLKLPRCSENNRFFGQFCRLDSVIVAGGYDPTHKMQYRVLDSAGMLISTGDAVVSEINSQYYILSLVGSQARLFSMLLNSGWDTAKAAEGNGYTLMTDWLTVRKVGLMFLDDQINLLNAAMVYASWVIDRPKFTFSAMRGTPSLLTDYALVGDEHVTETLAFIASIIGFAPTSQGRYPNFESDKWLDVGTFKATVPVLGNIEFRPISGNPGFLSADYLPVLCSERDFNNNPSGQIIDVNDGIIEAQIDEFRSYYQQPFIYVSALWGLMAWDFRKITGYDLELDERWFSEAELGRLVYMLPQLYNKDDEPLGNKNNVEGSNIHYLGASGSSSATPQHVLSDTMQLWQIPNVVSIDKAERAVFSGILSVSFGMSVSYTGSEVFYFAPCNAIRVEIGLEDSGHYYRKGYILCPLPTDGKITKADYQASAYLNLYEYISLGYSVLYPEYTPFDENIPTQVWLADISNDIGSVFVEGYTTRNIDIETAFVNDYNAFASFVGDDLRYSALPPKIKSEIKGTVQAFRQSRSAAQISLGRLFRDIKPFDILLQFTKSRHLLWLVDDINEKVRVVRAKDFYLDAYNNGLSDLTPNVSDKDMRICPLSWKHHDVVLNLTDIEADYVSGYEQRHGITYGSKLIKTQNNLNGERLELLGENERSTVKVSALLSENIIPATDLTNTKQEYVEFFPMPLNIKDGESANVSGNFYYRHDNGFWVLKSNAKSKPVHITDDTAKEQVFLRYCWHGTDAYDVNFTTPYHITTIARPILNTVSDGGLSVLFAPAREQYTTQPDQPTAYLYERCWQNYIEEVYNAQNKTLEAYIHLPRKVFDTVRDNPFVRIGDMVYLMTYIKGWGEHNTHVRCTLRQITDINNLTQ